MIWKLKKGSDRRLRSGHPWVLRGEVATPTGGLEPGSWVEVQDDAGKFLARGYGNPESQILFRAMSFDPREKDFLQKPRLIDRIMQSWNSRNRSGYRASFRLVFAEGDDLPGLIIDRYVGSPNGISLQVLAFQVLTAGINKAIGDVESFSKEIVEEALKRGLSQHTWENTAVVLRNDVRARDAEGLKDEPSRFVKAVRGTEFTRFPIELNAAMDDGVVKMDCDLFQGQKTGFFLDQTGNIRRVAEILSMDPALPKDRPIRILDLCCYVGHWSTQLTRVLKNRGFQVEATLVDVSKKALEFAKTNVEREGGTAVVVEQDVFKAMTGLNAGFDVVIADPPAFIKAKKDIGIGQHAYMRLNDGAARLTAVGGLLVSCSCSGLLGEEEFRQSISKALRRNGAAARCISKGGPAADHPGRLGFPEGMYLKMYVHRMPFQAFGAVAGAEVTAEDEAEVVLPTDVD